MPVWVPGGEYDEQDCAACPACDHPTEYDQHVLYPCPTLRHLGSIWRGHPDYQQWWAPTEDATG